MIPILMSKDDLLAALEARRPWATARDKRITKRHEQAERDALSRFRARLREALKWDYNYASGKFDEDGNQRRHPRPPEVELDQAPSCPRLTTPRLERAIRDVSLSAQTKYTLSDTNPWREELYWLLTHDDDAPAESPC